MPKEKLYYELAWIWPIMSPPEEYAQEADFFIELIKKHGRRDSGRVLDLGSGGGNIDYWLKKKFEIDNHICGIFSLDTWKRLLENAGFEGIEEEQFISSADTNEGYRVLVGHKTR